MRSFPRIVLVLCLAAVASCDSDEQKFSGQFLNSPPAGLLERIKAAPETLVVGGVEYRVRVEAWRSFMPISPADGHPLAGVVVLEAAGRDTFPAEVVARSIWLINDRAVWHQTLQLEAGHYPPREQFARFWGGPLWGPGIDVVAVVDVMGPGEVQQRVRLPQVRIARIE
jgi:hypothetical protein